jgi:hypothetical protein
VDEALRLPDYGNVPVDESGKAPLRGERTVAVPKLALGGGTEEGGMIGEGSGNLGKKVGALRQDVVAVAVGQPIGCRNTAVNDFLETEDIGLRFGDPRQQPVMLGAAPSVQTDDLHGARPCHNASPRAPSASRRATARSDDVVDERGK